MDDEVVVRAATIGVGVFIALVIFGALNNYYTTARYQAKNIAEGANIDNTYEQSIKSSFEKEELYGYEIKNLINHYNKSSTVRVDIHNANYLDASRQVLYRAFINANDADIRGGSTGSYESAVNLLFPFQKFRLVRFEINEDGNNDYETYVLDGLYDKSKEDEYNIEEIEPNQLKQMMLYYFENTYIIVEIRNVQNIRTRLDPITDIHGNIIGYTPVNYIERKDFYNANNSFATGHAKVYDEALAAINNNQEYTVHKNQTAGFLRYTIIGKDIRLEWYGCKNIYN